MPLVDKRYAEALVDVAEANSSIDSTQTELEIFAQMYSKQHELARFLHAPEIGNEEKKSVVESIFSGSDSAVCPFLKLLIDKDRISNLPGIFKEYVEIADNRKKVLKIEIRTAADIDSAQLEKIKNKYKKEYGAVDAKATVEVDPGLLGGLVVKIGDRVIDGSIKGRLEGLKNATINM